MSKFTPFASLYSDPAYVRVVVCQFPSIRLNPKRLYQEIVMDIGDILLTINKSINRVLKYYNLEYFLESGTIDFDEFVKIFAQKMSIDPEKELFEVFQVFDKNKDGFISSEELYEVLSKLGESITRVSLYKRSVSPL